MEDVRFIETSDFPVKEVSEQSAKEKQGGGRPPHWEMVFWWTRKPLASARAVIAGALLPAGIDRNRFIRALRLNENVAHRYNPSIPDEWREYFEGKTLLDPFAGFGSIPLEALRLGLSVTAVELLPTAYVFLKAVLEFPLKYGDRMKEVNPEEAKELGIPVRGRKVPELVYDVARWGKWVTDRLREDPDIRELYEDDVAVYIGTWEVKCPHCGRWTPLVGNWWLARVKDSKGEYKRLAWMEPYVEGDEVKIRVRDLNRELGGIPKGTKVDTKAGKVEALGRKLRLKDTNISPRSEHATCLACGNGIHFIDPKTMDHFLDKKSAPKDVRNRLIWYVKYSLRTFFENVKEPLARPRILVKVKVNGKDLEFISADKNDNKALYVAREKLRMVTEDPDIPREIISPYSNRYIFPILYGMTEWYKLFNPRQLLTLVKLVKLIREAGKKVEEEKLREGWSKEDAFGYAEAVTTYLAIALTRFVDHNNVSTLLHPSNPMGIEIAHALSSRGIAMMWNWGDTAPLAKTSGIIRANSWIKCLNKEIESLEYLIKASLINPANLFVDNSTDNYGKRKEHKENYKVTIVLGDAITLNKSINFDNERERSNLIVTDPPYYDDVPYTELSDLYYVWLKRALSDSDGTKLKPRFLKEAFFKEIRGRHIEIPTQWEEYAQREVSLNVGRLGPNATKEDAVKHFQNLLNSSFLSMSKVLADDGLLVTYYAHTSPEAWKALLKAGWEVSGMRVTNAFPLVTESAQRVTARGKLSLDTSIVVVWRKGSSGSVKASDLYETMISASADRATEMIERGVKGADLLVSSLAAALSTATRYREVTDIGRLKTEELVDRYVYPATMLGIVRGVSKKSGLRDGVRSPESMFYLILKVLLRGLKRKKLSANDARLIAIGTSADLRQLIDKAKVLSKTKNEIYLMDPPSSDRSELERFLLNREVEPNRPEIRNSIDVLHLLEYYSVVLPGNEFKEKLEDLKASNPREAQEAISLAKILSAVLPDSDPEKELASRVVGRIRQGVLPVG